MSAGLSWSRSPSIARASRWFVPFLKRLGLTFLVGLDPEQTVARLYRVWALPSTFILDRKGIPRFSVHGAREWDGPAGHALFEELLKPGS